MKATIENRLVLGSNLDKWAAKYQPELFKVTGEEWLGLMDSLMRMDMYNALEELKKRGWKPNGWLIRAIAETWKAED